MYKTDWRGWGGVLKLYIRIDSNIIYFLSSVNNKIKVISLYMIFAPRPPSYQFCTWILHVTHVRGGGPLFI